MLLPRARRLRAFSRTCRFDAKELRSTTFCLANEYRGRLDQAVAVHYVEFRAVVAHNHIGSAPVDAALVADLANQAHSVENPGGPNASVSVKLGELLDPAAVPKQPREEGQNA